MSSTSLEYRRDVDGLRAVAVLAIVLFHFDVAGFDGGFVGVDIFFVISGYLIGSIVLRQLAQGRFSFADFYARRARRLFPAAMVMLLVSAAVAHWLLLPRDYKEFGQSLGASVLYLSNVFFYLKAGYFDTASHAKPLLHTWSLAVEEQFYLFFPLLAWAAFRWWRQRVVALFAVLGLLSFAASLWVLDVDQRAAFYLYPFRAWEMFLGVVLAALQARGVALAPAGRWGGEAMRAAGLALMLAAVFAFDRHTPFPGWAVLMPCAGAALVIAAGLGQPGPLHRLVASAPMVFFGRISYSLYLWHWPVAVFYAYGYARPQSLAESLALVAATVGLAWLSTRFIEQPFRESSVIVRLPPGRVLAAAGVATLLPLSVALVLHRGEGLPGRLDGPTAKVAVAANDFLQGFSGGCLEADNATIPGALHCATPGARSAEHVTVVWGDSHAAAIKLAFFKRAGERQREGVLFYRAGCPPVLGVAKQESVSNAAENAQCVQHNQAVWRWLEAQGSRVDAVLLVGRWAYYAQGRGVGLDSDITVRLLREAGGAQPDQSALLAEGLQATVDALHARGRRVVLLEQFPEFEAFRASTLARSLRSGKADFEQSVQQLAVIDRDRVNERQRALLALQRQLAADGRVTVLGTHGHFCDATRCNLMYEGVPGYFDNNHITNATAMRLRGLFDAVFDPPAPAVAAGTAIGRAP